jgi:hypothetical protein
MSGVSARQFLQSLVRLDTLTEGRRLALTWNRVGARIAQGGGSSSLPQIFLRRPVEIAVGRVMSNDSTHAAPMPERLLPAWAISIFFHASLIALLVVAIQPWPSGTADQSNQSVGIILNSDSAEGNLHEGDEGKSNSAAGDEAAPEPPALLTPPQETAATEINRDAPQSPFVKLAAAPIAETGGGQPNKVQSPADKGLRGSPGGSGYAKVSVFGVEGKGSKFVYLFDRSASMEGPPLAAAKRQLLESMRSLESVHQFHVIFFNTKTHKFDLAGGGHRIAFATDRNKQLAANFVGGITADGGTDRVVALREAIAYSPDVIFFLTDADDPMSASELAEIARVNRRTQAAICVIEFGRRQAPAPKNFLMQLASESAGQYGYIDTTKLPKVAVP